MKSPNTNASAPEWSPPAQGRYVRVAGHGTQSGEWVSVILNETLEGRWIRCEVEPIEQVGTSEFIVSWDDEPIVSHVLERSKIVVDVPASEEGKYTYEVESTVSSVTEIKVRFMIFDASPATST